jgi:hypothetical protein
LDAIEGTGWSLVGAVALRIYELSACSQLRRRKEKTNQAGSPPFINNDEWSGKNLFYLKPASRSLEVPFLMNAAEEVEEQLGGHRPAAFRFAANHRSPASNLACSQTRIAGL